MQQHKGRLGLTLISLMACLVVGNAAALAADADLTPAGAQLSASTDGRIPAWEGKDTPVAGWSPDKPRGAFWQHKGEKPLYSIDAANVDKYADKLSPGQVAFIKATKGYRMDVYPTHRNCGAPDWVQANSKRNLAEAKMAADGVTLENAVLPGVAFPHPKNGAEAMWNFQTRYRGMGVVFPSFYTVLSPRAGSDEWVDANQEMTLYFPWAKRAQPRPPRSRTPCRRSSSSTSRRPPWQARALSV